MEVPDQIEEVVEEAKEQIEEIISNPVLQRKETVAAIAGVAGLLIGGVGGYILGKRRGKTTVIEGTLEVTEKEFENPNQLKLELDAEDLEKIRERQRMDSAMDHISRPTEEIPEEVVIRDIPIAVEEEPEAEPPAAEIEVTGVEEVAETVELMVDGAVDPIATIQHAFAQSGDTWDYEAEVAGRSEKALYIIHRDEFLEDGEGLHQATLTYYEKDDILVDEQSVPVFNIKDTVGEFAWGHGSGDPNVYYVRNTARHAEFEVLRHTGSYSMEVLGLEEEPADADTRIRKFRDRDE